MDLIKDWLKRQLSNPQIVLLASVLLVVFLTIFFLGGFLAPVLASVVIAYLLDGIIMRFQKHGVPRLVAVCGVFVLFLLSVFLLFFVVFPSLVSELDKFVRNDVPGIVTNVSNNMKGAYQKYEYFRNKRLPDFFSKQLQSSEPANPPQTNTESSNSRPLVNTNEIQGPRPLLDEAQFNGVSLLASRLTPLNCASSSKGRGPCISLVFTSGRLLELSVFVWGGFAGSDDCNCLLKKSGSRLFLKYSYFW